MWKKVAYGYAGSVIIYYKIKLMDNKKEARSFNETLAAICFELVFNNRFDKVYYTLGEGYMGPIDWAITLAYEFEAKFSGKEWDGEWIEEIESFVSEKLFNLKDHG